MSYLPLELLEIIISETWNFSLTPDERIHLMTSWTLISHPWTMAFIRTASTNVHIPCPSYGQYLVDLLGQTT
ncbi:hypothetical protein VKT23_016736, partial [Stygiomarasmius scandens]